MAGCGMSSIHADQATLCLRSLSAKAHTVHQAQSLGLTPSVVLLKLALHQRLAAQHCRRAGVAGVGRQSSMRLMVLMGPCHLALRAG